MGAIPRKRSAAVPVCRSISFAPLLLSHRFSPRSSGNFRAPSAVRTSARAVHERCPSAAHGVHASMSLSREAWGAVYLTPLLPRAPSVYIVRGLSGSGKSSISNAIKAAVGAGNVVVASADDYFMRPDGSYVFVGTQLPDAHAACKQTFVAALDAGAPVIILDNTNTAAWEYAPYEQLVVEANAGIAQGRWPPVRWPLDVPASLRAGSSTTFSAAAVAAAAAAGADAGFRYDTAASATAAVARPGSTDAAGGSSTAAATPAMPARAPGQYNLYIVEIGCPDETSLRVFTNRNKHNVPYEVLVKQHARWQPDPRAYVVPPYITPDDVAAALANPAIQAAAATAASAAASSRVVAGAGVGAGAGAGAIVQSGARNGHPHDNSHRNKRSSPGAESGEPKPYFKPRGQRSPDQRQPHCSGSASGHELTHPAARPVPTNSGQWQPPRSPPATEPRAAAEAAAVEARTSPVASPAHTASMARMPPSPAAIASRVVYLGLFLLRPHRDMLLQSISPRHGVVIADHVTIVYAPRPEHISALVPQCLGSLVPLLVTGVASSRRVQAVTVSWATPVPEMLRAAVGSAAGGAGFDRDFAARAEDRKDGEGGEEDDADEDADEDEEEDGPDVPRDQGARVAGARAPFSLGAPRDESPAVGDNGRGLPSSAAYASVSGGGIGGGEAGVEVPPWADASAEEDAEAQVRVRAALAAIAPRNALSTNWVPHITISTTPGTPAADANKLLARRRRIREIDSPFVVKARLGVVVVDAAGRRRFVFNPPAWAAFLASLEP